MFKKRLLPVFVAMAATGSLPAQAQDSSDSALEEEIIVTGVRNAELNARQSERNKNIFSSVIAQDDAGNFADQNVAESLQRLPGITLQREEGEGKFVSVRGLGPGFVSVNMNGAELASASSDTRAFALDAIPADLLGSIEVFKSLTPDMDLNSIGGTVNVKTVSAFDRKRDTMQLTVQGTYQDYAEEVSPKVTFRGTNLFAGDTIGVGYSISWEKRMTELYEQVHHNDTLPEYRSVTHPTANPDAVILAPFEFETRQEEAERTRLAGSLDLGWRPNEDSEYYLRLSRTEFEDKDVALREYYRFNPSGADLIAYVDPQSGMFAALDAEVQQQYFIQEGEAITTTFAIGGENVFSSTSGDWTLDYDYTNSVGEFSKPDGRRVQFRLQDLPVLGMAGRDFVVGAVRSPEYLAELTGGSVTDYQIAETQGWTRYTPGSRVQPNMSYDNIFIEDSFREDTLDQVSVNLRKDFTDGFVSYIKTGIQAKWRDRDRNKDRWSLDPRRFTQFCNGDQQCLDWAGGATLADFDTFRPNNPMFDHDFITQADAERLLASTWNVAKGLDPLGVDDDSIKEDYLLTEDTQAAYVMADFRLAEKQSLIAGVRYEKTEFTSTGYFSVRNDRLEETLGIKQDVAVPLAGAESSYDDFFPSLHYRYEMRDDVLVRASLWTSFTRPSFDQARAFANIEGRIRLCDPSRPEIPCTDEIQRSPTATTRPGFGVETPEDIQNLVMASDNILSFGNPTLEAMTSTNFDASISWYADEDLFLQAAFFYKDIDDFIVNVRGTGMNIQDLPVDLPSISEFIIPEDLYIDNVNWSTNGDKAKVYGVELSYSQYFKSGFFIQSNVTVMDSEAEVGETIRAGKIQLPDQADLTANLSVGWENERWSLRLNGNYRSEILERIGACSEADIAADQASGLAYPENCAEWADMFYDASFMVDAQATYQATKDIKITFDAINLTEQTSDRYFAGNAYSNGKTFFRMEDYGASFQLGVNVRFK
ncbi:TonB-dependent receptor [Cellvibrio sp. ARAG 10.3]|uniref:TonB-dependent receptor n=1 Tax=Cellvibrio sp. ARAG 10.3 TaxID=3451358 RepID=UPI003F44DA5D